MKKELHKAYFALGLVSFFWGTTYIASRIGAQHMPGLFVSGYAPVFIRNYTGRLFFNKRISDTRMESTEKNFHPKYFHVVYGQWITYLVGGIYQRGACRYYCGIGTFIYCPVYGMAVQMCKDHAVDGRWIGRRFCRRTCHLL